MKRILFMENVALCSLLSVTTAFPCTTFVLEGGGKIYFGRNLDWDWESGMVVVNPRGVQKTALVMPGHAPAKWKSKYGSVTFNQFGDEVPFGGMNEAGLVVDNMWLDETQYPTADSRPEINMLQWVQYQLDTCRTVAEVLANDSKIRLEQPTVKARIHYLVCDSAGDCATIEFLNGAMVSHQGQTLPYRALANDTYENSLAFARAHPAPEGALAKLNDRGSLSRFTLAATRATRFKPGTAGEDLDYAFETLDQVCQGNYTVWRIVYDISARQIHFRTRSNPQPRTLDFKNFDFTCAHPVQFADLHSKPSASGSLEFQDLTEARHRQYLDGFVRQESLKQAVGDLTLTVEALFLTLRGYSCADR